MALTPLVKWVGGKTRLLPALRARLPSVYRTYYEPFAGGAALFFACTVANGVLGDTNASLMNLYQVVAQQPQALEAWLLVHRHAHVRKAYYYEIRAAWNQGVFRADPVAHAATFLYLNRTCYNGLWRVNKQGAFNTPRGDYAKPLFFDPARLAATARVLQRTRLLVGDYMTTTQTAVAGDFVYFDPPYDPLTSSANFTAYTHETFGRAQQETLAQYATALRRRGVYVMLSNNDTPFVRDLYRGFDIGTVACARNISAQSTARVKVDEVIITSYPSIN